MNKIKQLLFLSLLVSLLSCSKKIDHPEWVINEVVVENEAGFLNNYGERSGWVEVFNSTYKTMDLGGRYLTDDPANPKKYPIPRGDVLTLIKPRQHTLFFADGQPGRGTFHLNFVLDPAKENYIGLYDRDGKTLLDEITIPALSADQSFGYVDDGVKYDDEGKVLATVLPSVTPSGNNAILEENVKVTAMQEGDPYGLTLTITSISIVFIGLILLYVIFKLIGNAAKSLSQRRVAHTGSLSAVRGESVLTGEVLAAISAAIHELNQDVHDIESTILTISEVKRRYSPWSSKIHTLRQEPKK